MSLRRRVFYLIGIMSVIVLLVQTFSVLTLYRVAIAEERARLTETAKSQARLIEAVARFDKVYSVAYPTGPRKATLAQIRDAHARYEGFGETGEFTLSERKGDTINFLLRHRHFDLEEPQAVPWVSKLAEPMRQALSGKSGTIIGLDYRGETVLAAYEPVAELDLGIVAKIDLAEIQRPFIRAFVMSGGLFFVGILFGTMLFVKLTNPIVTGYNETVAQLESAQEEVKTLRGILPICSYCKKIRDDEGIWNQVEEYVQKRSDANFSHGICPECVQRYFPQQYEAILKKNDS